ncbi:unnamed protein product [Linum trigynum]|uniref:SGNH hydrolase-type esterase domain-containing protein n=1 Tax=Linum trigynum TaxID=586398 RepID=A0AAV2DYM2_9ROSI
MVGTARPVFVLFGSSIVQFSYGVGGWGAMLSDYYSRKADILIRGYGGWNSRDALKVLEQVFPKDAATHPALVIVYFGGNDSCSQDRSIAHVPLSEYYENMKKIAAHLKGLSETIRLIFLTPPPVNEKMVTKYFGDCGRTNESCRMYAEACMKMCSEMGVTGIDLWTVFQQQREDWQTAYFIDGIHLTSEGSKVVGNEILKVIEESEWEPSLHWESMPCEFSGVTLFDTLGYNHFLNSSLP